MAINDASCLKVASARVYLVLKPHVGIVLVGIPQALR